MNADTIRDFLRRQPFEPFEVHLSNGEIYAVRHPEQAMLAGNRLHIYLPETDRVTACSILHIANILTQQPSS